MSWAARATSLWVHDQARLLRILMDFRYSTGLKIKDSCKGCLWKRTPQNPIVDLLSNFEWLFGCIPSPKFRLSRPHTTLISFDYNDYIQNIDTLLVHLVSSSTLECLTHSCQSCHVKSCSLIFIPGSSSGSGSISGTKEKVTDMSGDKRGTWTSGRRQDFWKDGNAPHNNAFPNFPIQWW